MIPTATITGTTYYVSPTGSDTSSGISPNQAWQTMFRVDKALLKPGDGVLFEGGATFSDDALMPGWGSDVSGTAGSPVVFGSYGHGRATLTQGVWTKHEHHLVFQNLNLGPQGGVGGTGDDITVQGCTMRNFMSHTEIPIMVLGSRWIIRDNVIDRTGDSGMQLRGDQFLVADNTITNTGLDPAITYGDHGVYLKAPNSTVTGNTITNFHDNGVSVRYRNSVVTGNKISGGQFGIAWFQYDPEAGTSHWTDNTITDTAVAGIYVSPHDIAGYTRESFVISANKIGKPTGSSAHALLAAGWQPLSLSATTGRYFVSGNLIL